jgi:hypothetical protein
MGVQSLDEKPESTQRFGSVEGLAVLLISLVVLRAPISSAIDDPRLQTWTTVFVSVMVQAVPFLVFGVVLSAVIAVFVPRSFWARALRLDDAERGHLYDLARQANTSPRNAHRRTTRQVRPGVRQLLDTMTGSPAYVRNGRLDILAVNDLGRAVFTPIFENTAGTPNLARFVFLDPASQTFYRDWGQLAEDVVALLRSEAGRDPYDRDLSNLVGELTTRSDHFRTWWAAHNVRLHRTGVKNLHHPVIGDLTLAYESLDLTADQGLRLNAYSATPGSPDRDALDLLASWTATHDQHRVGERG